MMPVGHAASCTFLKRYFSAGTTWRRYVLFLLLVSPIYHYLGDAIPHPEPSYVDGESFLVPFSWKFWWTGLEISAASFYVWLLMCRYESLRNWRFPVFVVSVIAWDFTMPLGEWFDSPFFRTVSDYHTSSHALWRRLLGVTPGVPVRSAVWTISVTLYATIIALPFALLPRSSRAENAGQEKETGRKPLAALQEPTV